MSDLGSRQGWLEQAHASSPVAAPLRRLGLFSAEGWRGGGPGTLWRRFPPLVLLASVADRFALCFLVLLRGAWAFAGRRGSARTFLGCASITSKLNSLEEQEQGGGKAILAYLGGMPAEELLEVSGSDERSVLGVLWRGLKGDVQGLLRYFLSLALAITWAGPARPAGEGSCAARLGWVQAWLAAANPGWVQVSAGCAFVATGVLRGSMHVGAWREGRHAGVLRDWTQACGGWGHAGEACCAGGCAKGWIWISLGLKGGLGVQLRGAGRAGIWSGGYDTPRPRPLEMPGDARAVN